MCPEIELAAQSATVAACSQESQGLPAQSEQQVATSVVPIVERLLQVSDAC